MLLVIVIGLALLAVLGWYLAWIQGTVISLQHELIHELRRQMKEVEERMSIWGSISPRAVALPPADRKRLASLIQQESRRYDLDWQLLLGIIQVESGFNPRARSSRRAVGLMQVRPAVFQEVATALGWADSDPGELEDLRVNVRVGSHYLFTMVRRFGDLKKAVQAYHLGPSRVRNPTERWERLGHQYLEAVRLSHSEPCRRTQGLCPAPIQRRNADGTANHPRRGGQSS